MSQVILHGVHFRYMNKMRWGVVCFGLVILGFVLFDRVLAPEADYDMLAYAETYRIEHDLPMPPQMFVYDGCTLFPERMMGHDFSTACLRHDVAYWLGGSDADKVRADAVFRDALSTSGPLGFVFAPLMHTAVRIFGDTWIAKLCNANWGFGWN